MDTIEELKSSSKAKIKFNYLPEKFLFDIYEELRSNEKKIKINPSFYEKENMTKKK